MHTDMSGDLYWGLALMALVCAASFAAGVWLSRRLPRRGAVLIAAIDLTAVILFMKFVWDHPLLIRLIPRSNVIVLANFQPPMSALLGGIAWGLITGSTRRKLLFVAPLLLISLWRGYGRLFEAPPQTRADMRWKGDVCRQSSNATCSAAAAVTLLRHYGIDATEQEMARLSLTRVDGTTVHGRYRGLLLKTRGTPFTVIPISGQTVEDLMRLHPSQLPLILSVGLIDPKADPRYVDTYGWLPGMRHTVVLFGFTPYGKAEIGDPSVGREEWEIHDLRVLFRGTGFRLVRR